MGSLSQLVSFGAQDMHLAWDPFMGLPDNDKTVEICQDAILRKSSNFLFVPTSMITVEMCQFAIRSNLYVLRCVTTCIELDVCAVTEICDKKRLDEVMGSERRKRAVRLLDEELTKGAK